VIVHVAFIAGSRTRHVRWLPSETSLIKGADPTKEARSLVAHIDLSKRLLLGLVAVALTAAACGGSTAAGDSGGNGLTGTISVSGSSTVEPISSLVAEKFRSEYPDVSISVNGPGTTDGFALFCEGEVDIADASRPISQEEIAACEQAGISYVQLKVAIDGITVITSPENEEVDCLGFEDLYALLGPESEGFETWKDAEPLARELGSKHLPYPDAPLVVTAPGEESGTWGSFIELALEGIGEERGIDEVATRADYQSSPNDNVIVQGIEGSPSSLGWVGYAFYEQTQGAVKAIQVEGSQGCVEPSAETISNRTYPLARDLFIYVNTDEAAKDEALASFVDFYLSEEGLASVAEVGYVDQPEEALAETHEAWELDTEA
jgi:phosphate transport system substrate-binding protein